MYCENCGQKIGNEKFCINCGAAIRESDDGFTSNLHEEKAWYRLLKVLYILLFGLTAIVLLVVIYNVKPQPEINQKLSTIICNNGKIYPLEPNNLYAFGETLWSVEDNHARILCQYNTLDYYNYLYSNQFIEKNCQINLQYTKPDYNTWIFYSFLAIVISWISLKLIRIGIQYVTLGIKPRWKKELNKLF